MSCFENYKLKSKIANLLMGVFEVSLVKKYEIYDYEYTVDKPGHGGTNRVATRIVFSKCLIRDPEGLSLSAHDRKNAYVRVQFREMFINDEHTNSPFQIEWRDEDAVVTEEGIRKVLDDYAVLRKTGVFDENTILNRMENALNGFFKDWPELNPDPVTKIRRGLYREEFKRK